MTYSRFASNRQKNFRRFARLSANSYFQFSVNVLLCVEFMNAKNVNAL
jgi:hypothetical protein